MSDAAKTVDDKTVDYEVGRDNITPFGLDIHNPVFLISGLSVVAFVIVTLMFQQGATEFFGWLRPFLTSTFDWFFIGAGDIFVLFTIFLIVSPLGRIRLGGKDARPDYSYIGWFSMLFAAGMGIGLMFFGVSEPMSHFASSMGGTVVENGVRTDWAPLGAAAGDAMAARSLGMAATIYHWALHPWAIYATVALALAFFTFNRGMPLTLRSAFIRCSATGCGAGPGTSSIPWRCLPPSSGSQLRSASAPSRRWQGSTTCSAGVPEILPRCC